MPFGQSFRTASVVTWVRWRPYRPPPCTSFWRPPPGSLSAESCASQRQRRLAPDPRGGVLSREQAWGRIQLEARCGRGTRLPSIHGRRSCARPRSGSHSRRRRRQQERACSGVHGRYSLVTAARDQDISPHLSIHDFGSALRSPLLVRSTDSPKATPRGRTPALRAGRGGRQGPT